MCRVTEIAQFEHSVGGKLLLDREVVLIHVRRAKLGSDEVNATATEGNKTGRSEINVFRGRLGWERIDRARSSERILQSAWCDAGGGGDVREAEEGRLTIELQIVFALQDVIENTESAAQAGLRIPKNVIGKAE